MTSADKIKKALNNSIEELAKQAERFVKNPKSDFTRNRKLSFTDTVKFLFSANGQSINKELRAFFKDDKSKRPSASAFIQQRSKLKPECFEELFQSFNSACKDSNTLFGKKIYIADGTDLTFHPNKGSKTFINSLADPKGNSIFHINTLLDYCSGVYVDCLIQPRTAYDERSALISMLERNPCAEKTLLIADRGYEGYNLFAHLLQTPNLDFLIRVRQNAGALKEIRNLPMISLDTDLEITVTTTQTNEDKHKRRTVIHTGSIKGKTNSPKTTIQKWDFASPYTLKFRVVRFQLKTGEYETIVTTLDRKEFPSHVIKNLYHMRWAIETSYRTLKYDIGLVNLHSRKDEFVLQEIFLSLTLFNFCKRIVNSIEIKQKSKRKYEYKVNLSDAVDVCKYFYRHKWISGKSVIQEIQKNLIPVRPERSDERKIKPKGFVGFNYRVA